MSLSEMMSKAIQITDRGLVSREIVEVLVKHGIAESQSETWLNKVQSALNRRASEAGDIAHIGDGKWVLTSWYTDKELKDLTSKVDGANARDRQELRKRTKEGIAAHK
ncbi:MAG: hypothetical protein PF480_00070, partial [Roseovarius sp.]|nr:hypothetical protein [Roseovarius sp.]